MYTTRWFDLCLCACACVYSVSGWCLVVEKAQTSNAWALPRASTSLRMSTVLCSASTMYRHVMMW